MNNILFVISVCVFMICSVILHFERNDTIESIQQNISTMRKQMDIYEQSLLTAEREKEKVEMEYAETKKSLQRLVKDYGLSDLALPDDVMRLLKEGTVRTSDVPPPGDAAGRD